MRIIGGKDYYDGALAYGADEDIVFVRSNDAETEIIPYMDVPLEAPPPYFDLSEKEGRRHSRILTYHDYVYNRDSYEIYSFRIWFVARVYNAIIIHNTTKKEKEIYWNLEDALKGLERIGLFPRNGKMNFFYRKERDICEFFKKTETENETNFLIDNGISIAIWNSDLNNMRGSYYRNEGAGWKFNTDGLKSTGFASIMDAYTAMQELSMYVGGVLVDLGRKMVEISDMDRIHKHGFDKWSFRKMSENKEK